jgi:hypothetical protein
VAAKKFEAPIVKHKKGLKAFLIDKITKRVEKRIEKWNATSPDGKNRGLNIAFGFLLFFVALAAMYLIAALSCTLACEGHGALAWIVFLLGTVGVIFLLSISSRKLFPKLTKGQSWLVGSGILGLIFLILAVL